ncbi:unnamed protein product [Cercospora beticola]|nr:unnamed protein product [Cercospora beticola]
MSGHQIAEIDPQGDVVLAFNSADGTSSARLRVSSVALRFGSPVFNRMLHSNFKEGQQFKATGYVEIPLEDDSKGMTVLCRALHLQHKVVMVKLSSKDLLKVAEVCDKYDCIEALAPLADFWLKDRKPDRGTVLAAYLFRRQELFSKIATSFFVDVDNYQEQDAENPVLSELWENLIDAMEFERYSIEDDIWDFIERQFFEVDDGNEEYATCADDCIAMAVYRCKFADAIDKNLLTPHRQFHNDCGLGQRIKSLEKATFVLPEKDNRFPCTADDCYMSNAKSGSEWEKVFRDGGKAFRRKLPKICLGCVMEGKMFKLNGCKHDEEV